MRRSATACFGVTVGLVGVRMAMVVRFVAVAVAFAVGMIVMLAVVMVVRFVAVAAAFAVCVSMFMLEFSNTCFGAMAATFAVLVSVFSSTRFVAVTAAFTMPVAVSIVMRMLVGMPFVPVGTGFGLFRAICFGEVGVWHGWLPGSICGLVNTLKPLQGQGRIPEGP